jgi:hypothetical protein
MVIPNIIISNDEYLEIKNKNGTIENISGPVSLQFNPYIHDNVTLHKKL